MGEVRSIFIPDNLSAVLSRAAPALGIRARLFGARIPELQGRFFGDVFYILLQPLLDIGGVLFQIVGYGVRNF